MLNNYYGRRRSDHCRCGLSNLYLRRKKGLGRKSLQVREYFPDPLLVGVLAIYFILSLTSNSLALFGMLQVVFHQIQSFLLAFTPHQMVMINK